MNNGKNGWVLLVFILAGLVVGGFLADIFSKVPYMAWLNYGSEIGLKTPVTLDLALLKVQLGFTINFTIGGIIGMIAAIFIFKRL